MEYQEESLLERQENELQVLQAVFLEDVRDLRSSAWKVAQPLEVLITLYPQQSAGGDGKFNCQIDLEVKCSHLYPTVIPNFTLKNSKGVSAQKLKELQGEIAELAVRLRGEVMIHEIAQHIQVWLHKQNEAPRFPSFYEEMISNQKKKEEEKELARKQEEEWEKQEAERKRKAIEEEILRRQEAFMIESRTRREQSPANVMQSYIEERRSSIGNSDKSKKNPTLSPYAMGRRRRLSARTESNSSQDSSDQQPGITSIKFKDRKVKRGKCLGLGRRGSRVYNALDVKSGELMIIIEWMLNLPQSRLIDLEEKELGNSLKQIAIIEQEFNSLLRLSHKNLVHYLGMNHFRIGTNYFIQILQEFVPGNPLSFHLTENVPVSCEFLQFYVNGILEGLSYLHNNSIVHRDLKDTNVFLDRGLVRIADYSLDKRLSELWSTVNKEGFEEAFPPSVGRGGKKADIYRLGIVCLSLLKGEIVETMFPEMPKNLPPLILDFLKRCMNTNEQERWSADRLLEHPFLKPSLKNEISLPLKQPEYQIEEKIEPEPEVPIVVAQDPSGKSRMVSEFSVLKWLGRGAFGDVYKVQNKLDGGVYAIKCIQLKSHNQQVNRKIMREVKLLSRLNHENVVRYFNSWLELGSMTKDSTKSDTDASYTNKASQVESSISAGFSMAEHAESVQETTFDKASNWKSSFLTDDNETSSSEDEYNNFGNTFLSHMSSSSHIVFASMNESTVQSNQTFNAADNLQRQNGHKKPDEHSTDQLVQFMYIQMEFCDKNTLRDAIDDGLYLDENRVWRLFREIIEGLSHIHEQGMIHRDLKPVNIFLDIQDHVKIGDFGLATKSSLTDLTPNFNVVSGLIEGDGIRSDDGSLTGWVGTRFYISPEVANCKSRVTYSQKVDIYSLGIIFFEMCYRNMATFMEKSKILECLRSPDVILPHDFDETKNSQQVAIIKWLLNHDPDKRPSSLELLQSSYLPPLQIEEAELHEMLRTTVSNPQSKAFKYLISTLFQQDTSTAANVTYDMIIKNKASFNRNNCVAFKFITDSIIKVFHKHGAVQVATPLIMPKTTLHENNDFCVKLVDHSGGVVTLPSDLRIPFCRFLVKNNISSLKRYFISSAYRERKVFGCHPRELYECAFDIVTPSPGNLIADAEVLSVIWEIVQEFPSISDCRSFVHVNHVSLLKGILLHCGIPEEIHQQFFATLNNVEIIGKIHAHARLSALGISEHCIVNVCRMIEVQGPISKIKNLLKPIVKRRGRESSLIKQGLSDLDTIINNAQAMGLPTSFIVTPNLVHKIDYFSSMLFQFVCELKKKRRKVGMEVIAAGGRYDKLIATMRSFVDVTEGQAVGQSGVGFSIAVEKMVSAILETDDYQNPNIFDVYVCSSGDRPLIKEKAGIVRKLWNSGISAHIQYDSNQSLEEIREYCKDFHAYAVIIKDTEVETIRIICWDKDRFLEKKVQSSEMIDYLLQRGLSKSEFGENSLSALKLENSRLERSSSESGLGACQYNIAFLTTEKLAPNLRRRHEGQIMSQLNHVIQRFSPKNSVEILVVELNSSVLKTLTTHLELDGNDEKLQTSMEQVVLKHQRHRKYLDKLCEHLSKFVSEKQFKSKNITSSWKIFFFNFSLCL